MVDAQPGFEWEIVIKIMFNQRNDAMPAAKTGRGGLERDRLDNGLELLCRAVKIDFDGAIEGNESLKDPHDKKITPQQVK